MLPTQGFLNLVSAGLAYAVSQDLVMSLLSSASSSSQTLSFFIESLVITAENKESKSDSRILASLQRAEKDITVLETIVNFTSIAPVLNHHEFAILADFANAIHSFVIHYKIHESDTKLSANILLTDATVPLNDVGIDQEKIKSTSRTNGSTHTNASLAHTKLARLFQQRDESKG